MRARDRLSNALARQVAELTAERDEARFELSVLRPQLAEIRGVVDEAMVFLDDDMQYTDPDGTLDRVSEILNR